MDKKEATEIYNQHKNLRCANTPSSEFCTARFIYNVNEKTYLKHGKDCYEFNDGVLEDVVINMLMEGLLVVA